MQYYECLFSADFASCEQPEEYQETIYDILAAELGEIGFDSFTQTPEGLNAYIHENLYDATQIQSQLENFPLEGVTIHFDAHPMENRNWNEEWERNYFQPVRIGSDCIIHASFHSIEPGYTYNIIIDPKMSFGTGNHETTHLMLTELLTLDLTGKNILDMGCGSGILAILASMKNAAHVTAIDIDEWAYTNTKENAALNSANIETHLGGASLLHSLAPFDIILANINRNILLNDIHLYTPALNPGGLLLVSGFYANDIPSIADESTANGLTLVSHTEKNNWVAVKFMKSQS
ncbi:MAG: 50S ribosomal protein L11 methyltransferase [Tannerellaceae bacterium]|jgi:ribosomal protein L11 methyltransferase|nr:50S ribosomal protein L11 methyltransferase [Tannerellaceae bacterium]